MLKIIKNGQNWDCEPRFQGNQITHNPHFDVSQEVDKICYEKRFHEEISKTH